MVSEGEENNNSETINEILQYPFYICIHLIIFTMFLVVVVRRLATRQNQAEVAVLEIQASLAEKQDFHQNCIFVLNYEIQ